MEKEEAAEVVNSQEEDNDDEYLKARISTHPLYGLLLQTHLDCLKVGSNGDHDLDECDALMDYWKQLENYKSVTPGKSEVDRFMEAYCLALEEAMEEPQRRSMTFIANMHHQLKELSLLHLPDSHATFHPLILEDQSRAQERDAASSCMRGAHDREYVF